MRPSPALVCLAALVVMPVVLAAQSPGAMPENHRATADRTGTQGQMDAVAQSARVLSGYVGVYEMTGQPIVRMSVWMSEGRLYADPWAATDSVPEARHLVPLDDSTFALGLWVDGAVADTGTGRVARFSRGADGVMKMDLMFDGATSQSLHRVEGYGLATDALVRLAGTWDVPGAPFVLQTVVAEGTLVIVDPSDKRSRLVPLSPAHFRDPEGGSTALLRFEVEGDQVVALVVSVAGRPAMRFPRKQ